MPRWSVMVMALFLATTTPIGAEPAVSMVSAEVDDGLFRVEATSGPAIVAARPAGELRLTVETRDVSRGEVLGRLEQRQAVVIAASSLRARAALQPRTSRQPLVTLFDHLEKPDPRAAAEHLTLGLDYRLEESGELPFEVAKSGSLGDRDDSHNLILRAQFSF